MARESEEGGPCLVPEWFHSQGEALQKFGCPAKKPHYVADVSEALRETHEQREGLNSECNLLKTAWSSLHPLGQVPSSAPRFPGVPRGVKLRHVQSCASAPGTNRTAAVKAAGAAGGCLARSFPTLPRGVLDWGPLILSDVPCLLLHRSH